MDIFVSKTICRLHLHHRKRPSSGKYLSIFPLYLPANCSWATNRPGRSESSGKIGTTDANPVSGASTDCTAASEVTREAHVQESICLNTYIFPPYFLPYFPANCFWATMQLAWAGSSGKIGTTDANADSGASTECTAAAAREAHVEIWSLSLSSSSCAWMCRAALVANCILYV
jgi:hypothetical protein